MALSYTYDGVAITHKVPPSLISIPQRAENGEPSFGGIPIEDPGSTLVMLGHRPFVVAESACSQPRLFTGYVAQRDMGRSYEQTQWIGADPRLFDTTIVDQNAIFGFRIIWDTDGNRPEETWDARLAWILGSDYMSGLFGGDTTFIDSHTNPMDAADYRGATPGAVFGDLVNRFESAMNYFAFWNPTTSAVEIAVFGVDDTTGDCTLLISNDADDIDASTIFAPDMVAKLAREPDQTYSEVIVEYANGKVYRSLASTATTYIQRGTTISRPYTGKESTAIAQGDQFLVSHSVERDRITCVMQSVPDESVGLIRAGMRMQVKFTHLPGYETYQWMRVVACSPVPISDLGTLYDISLELVSAVPVVQPTTTQMALCYSDTGCTTQDYPRVVMFDTLGDDPPAGWDPYATSGPVEALDCTNFESDPGYYAIQVNGDGTVNIEHYGGWATVTEFGDWISVTLRKNGVAIGTPYYWEDTVAGWGHGNSEDVYLLVEDEAVEDGDSFDVYVEIIPGFSATWYYRKVGVPWNPSLKVWGIVTPTVGESTTGDTIPTPTEPTTNVTDTPPTEDDDETLGYSVGDHWLDTDTGIEYVLVDATDGAAVWVSTTTHAAEDVTYDNGTSGLTATDVQAAIDEIVAETVLDTGTFTYLDAVEASAPGTPGSGTVRLYAKTDGRIYSKDDGGVEYGPFDAAGTAGSEPAYNTISTNSALFGGSAVSQGSGNLVAQTIYYIPFVVPADMTAKKMFYVTGATATGTSNMDIGIYNSAGTKVVAAGSTAYNTGVASALTVVDIADTALTAGQYYLAMVMDTPTGTCGVLRLSIGTRGTMPYGVLLEASTFPLPATATFALPGNNALIPICGVLARSEVV